MDINEKDFKFWIDQAVYVDGLERLYVIKEQFRDWNLETLGTSRQHATNMYVIGEYGYPNQTVIRVSEAHLRLWTLENARPGEVIAKTDRENEGEFWIGIFKSYDEEFKDVRVYLYTHHARQDVAEGMNTPFLSKGMRPATLEERKLLKERLDATGWKWDQDKLKISSES